MGDILKMSSKERRSLIELSRVKDGQQTLIEAAERLEFTCRHVRRVNKRFQQEGEQGLIHRGRGRGSNRSFPEAFRQECLELFGAEAGVAVVREGQGLLNPLLRCGRCGRKMHVRYWGKAGTAARYLCKGDFDSGGQYCLGFGSSLVDRRFRAKC